MSCSRVIVATLVAACVAFPSFSKGPVNGEMLNKIADAGFNHGEVVETAAYLSDHIGGRMTNSPAMRTAERWTQERFKTWGLENVRAEPYDFGRGWWIESSHVRMLTPRSVELRAIPIAWSPPTHGALAAPIIIAPMRTEKDFPDWKGKLTGKIVLVSWPDPVEENGRPPFSRLDDGAVAKHDKFEEPAYDPEAHQKLIDIFLFRRRLDDFLAAEGAVAMVRMSRNSTRLIHGEGYSFQAGMSPKLPQVEVSSEDYRRLARLAKQEEVRLEIDSNVHYEDADQHAYNILADLPGKEAKAGYVMAGAHLDSWVAGDGAADNGVGCAIVMEASRILASIGVQPKRTIRFALWSGEEQGLLGSGAFIQQHLARRPQSRDPEIAAMGPFFAPQGYPVEVLPAFQFIQDQLDYSSTVHHTDADTFDHLRPDDIRQAAVVMATVLLDAANADPALPGKPVPTQPRLTDPFHYKEPSKP